MIGQQKCNSNYLPFLIICPKIVNSEESTDSKINLGILSYLYSL